jgi:hypothetical protein
LRLWGMLDCVCECVPAPHGIRLGFPSYPPHSRHPPPTTAARAAGHRRRCPPGGSTFPPGGGHNIAATHPPTAATRVARHRCRCPPREAQPSRPGATTPQPPPPLLSLQSPHGHCLPIAPLPRPAQATRRRQHPVPRRPGAGARRARHRLVLQRDLLVLDLRGLLAVTDRQPREADFRVVPPLPRRQHGAVRAPCRRPPRAPRACIDEAVLFRVPGLALGPPLLLVPQRPTTRRSTPARQARAACRRSSARWRRCSPAPSGSRRPCSPPSVRCGRPQPSSTLARFPSHGAIAPHRRPPCFLAFLAAPDRPCQV